MTESLRGGQRRHVTASLRGGQRAQKRESPPETPAPTSVLLCLSSCTSNPVSCWCTQEGLDGSATWLPVTHMRDSSWDPDPPRLSYHRHLNSQWRSLTLSNESINPFSFPQPISASPSLLVRVSLSPSPILLFKYMNKSLNDFVEALSKGVYTQVSP